MFSIDFFRNFFFIDYFIIFRLIFQQTFLSLFQTIFLSIVAVFLSALFADFIPTPPPTVKKKFLFLFFVCLIFFFFFTKVVGIDLGTTFSCVALMQSAGGVANIVQDEKGKQNKKEKMK